MNWKTPAFASCLSALVAGWVVHRLDHPAPPVPASTPIDLPNPGPSQALSRIPGPRSHAAGLTSSPVAPTFHWSQIESGDYAQYTANLRAVGCPEQTVREILRADLAQALQPAGRLVAIPGEFWNSGFLTSPRTSSGSSRVESALDALVGLEPIPAPDLSFLPAAQAQAVNEWRERYDALEEALPESSIDTDDSETRSELSRRGDRELASLLTPEQLEDYQLRYSYMADELRSDLVGFEVTEEEFRQLFRALQAEQNGAREGRLDNAEDALRNILGEERHARYRRAQDPTFRDLVQEAADAGHPYEDAVALYSEIQAVRAAAGANESPATDVSAIGASIQTVMGSEMRLIFLDFAGR